MYCHIYICVLLATEFGVNISPKPQIFEKDVKVLRKMKMIWFCSEPMIMFDFYRWNGLSKIDSLDTGQVSTPPVL